MAKAIFYDRKHNCEVSAKKICHINLVVTLATTEDDYEAKRGEKTITSAFDAQRGELGYKSKNCPKGQNWDRWLNYSDLVFLRFE